MKMLRQLFLILSICFATFAWAESININTADAQTLTTLEGIGAAKAQAIIEYREKHGAFESLDQLTEVAGIGEKTLEKLKPSLALE